MSRSPADCFAPDADMLRAEQAVAALVGAVECGLGTERVPLMAGRGRILAEALVSGLTVPPHDNSAVDGYAVNSADLSADAEMRLPVVARITAGHPSAEGVPRGAAARIFTGGVLPAGVDTVVPQEACRVEAGEVVLPAGVKHGANTRRAGEDVRAGDVVVAAGTRLRPQEIGLAAAVGSTGLTVYRRLRAAVFSTGDEIRDPGTPAGAGCIYDSNRDAVAALLEALGAEVTDLGILPDRFEAVRDGLDAAARKHDLIVTSGGVSTGEEDHVKQVVEALGGLHLWRIAVRPGRPLAVGIVRGVPFVGLPGNPVAAMATFLMVVRPMLLKLMGAKPMGAASGPSSSRPVPVRARAGFAFRKRVGRREWLRGRLAPGADGFPIVERFPVEGSGILTSMVWAGGIVDLPEGLAGVAKGDFVDFLPFSELLA